MDTTIVISSDLLGSGPEDLGVRLMGSFLRKTCVDLVACGTCNRCFDLKEKLVV